MTQTLAENDGINIRVIRASSTDRHQAGNSDQSYDAF
jgi:hypothetical protein